MCNQSITDLWWRWIKSWTYENQILLCFPYVNSITAHNFSPKSLLEAYNAQHIFDKVQIYETYLDSRFPDDDPRLNLPGYSLVRLDNSNNTKRGSVCVYFMDSLALTFGNIPLLKGMPFIKGFYRRMQYFKNILKMEKLMLTTLIWKQIRQH